MGTPDTRVYEEDKVKGNGDLASRDSPRVKELTPHKDEGGLPGGVSVSCPIKSVLWYTTGV